MGSVAVSVFLTVNSRNNNLSPVSFTMTMKKIAPFLIPVLLLFACGNKSNTPDVSDIKVDLRIENFGDAFFRLDTNNILPGLQQLHHKFPDFYRDFMTEVLGVTNDTMHTTMVVKEFIKGYAAIYDTLRLVYKNTSDLEKDLKKGFQYVKYYFPSYKIGKIITFVGPFDAPGVATTNYGLAVGLQQFAGRNYSVYKTDQFQELYPLYISRRFSSEYIPVSCMKAVVQDVYPDQSGGKPLIEQMVEKGKQWWLLEKFMPFAHDTLKTGFTKTQVNWCNENEGLIWSYIVKNEDLNSLNPAIIQTYIGESPFTQGFSQELSPGNIGQWIGWQIVKKYVSKNSSKTIEEILKTPARTINDEAKYKPK